MQFWWVAVWVWLAGCSNPPEMQVISGPSMGSHYSVKIVEVPAGTTLDEINREVQVLLDDIEQVASTWKSDSELSRFNQSPVGEFRASKTLRDLVRLSLRACAETHGALDVTLGPLINLWGFGPDNSPEHLPSAEQIAAIKSRVGCHYLSVSDPSVSENTIAKSADIYVDLSSVTQGYAGTQVGALLDRLGVQAYLLDMSGELLSKGHKPDGSDWHVAVEVPQMGKLEQGGGSESIEKVVSLKGKAIATSGDYRNFVILDGQRVSHIIDPETGAPITHGLASVTVLDDDLGWADALDTAILVMGPDKGYAFAEQRHIPALLVIRTAEGFTEKMTPEFAEYVIPF